MKINESKCLDSVELMTNEKRLRSVNQTSRSVKNK